MLKKMHFRNTVCTFLSLCFLSSVASSETGNPYLEALPSWQKTLSTYVDELGRTDFISLKKDDAELVQFVGALQKVSPQNKPELFNTREQKLAYYINAYNALAMAGILERNIPKHFKSLFRRASFFKFRSLVVGEKKMDLYVLENKIIRPLDEPRIHFALNCMVRDCPRLPQTVFKPETLDQDLEALSVEFFNKDTHIKIDTKKQTVYLSSILKFYTKDFVASGKAQDLISYVNKYSKQKIPENYKVKFIKYDWTVNQQP